MKKNEKETSRKVKYLYNITRTTIKFKKQPFAKLQKDIELNSRIFFATQKSIENAEVITNKIDKAEEKIATKKSKNKKIFNILFFILNVVLVVAVFYNFAKEQGGVHSLSSLFANKPKWSFLFIAIGLYFVTVIFNSLKFLFLIYNRTKKWRPIFSFKIATIGRYYDLITPLGSGGQPFEIYYLKKEGYSGDVATAIPLAKYMVWQIAFMLICGFVLIAYSHNYVDSKLVVILAWIGLALILALFLFVLFMSITKKFGASLVVGVLKLLYKMHIIKDYRKTLVKVLKFVKQYQFCIKSFAKSPLTIITVLLSSIGSLLSNALIAYFIYISFVKNPTVGWWDIVCKCFICELAVSFVPLPGGSGATELSFNSLLGSLFTEGTLFWGILFWRILTYYLYILQGAIVIVIDLFKKKKKSPPISKEVKKSQN